MGETGEVFHLAGGRELAPREGTLEDERIEAGARGVDGGGKASATGADDDDVFNGGGHGGFPKKEPWKLRSATSEMAWVGKKRLPAGRPEFSFTG